MQNFKLYDVLIANKERDIAAHNCFCEVTTALDVLMQHAAEFLHPVELEYLATLQSPSRKNTYLRGRYAAKLALAHLHPNIPSTEIDIRNGMFAFPYIVSAHSINAQVGISHSDVNAVAIAFMPACPMALDVELVSPARIETIQSEMLPSELALLSGQIADMDRGLTIAWTAKEALAKALRCGLYIDFKYLELSEFAAAGNDYSCKYKNFAQYQARSFMLGEGVCTLVFPDKTSMRMLNASKN